MIDDQCDVLKNMIPLVLEKAKHFGATQAEACVSIDSGLITTVRLGTLETIECNHEINLSITVYIGKKKGVVSSTNTEPNALHSLVENACQIAHYAEEDPFAGLADPHLMAKETLDLDLYHPKEISTEDAIELCKICEAEALEFDPRITNSEGATFSAQSKFYAYGNSHHFLGSFPSTRYGMSCTILGQVNNLMQRDYDFSLARDFHDLNDWARIGKSAAKRVIKRLSPRRLKTQSAPVILTSNITPSFIGHFIAAISGGNLHRKSSFLIDSVDKQLFPNFVHIEEDPHLPKALGSAPFDQEGVATKKHCIVSDGYLKNYVLSTYSAKKLGLQTTGNSGGIHNLIISHSNLTLNELIKKMHKGLVVTELMGFGINIQTGDYSRGAFGFWVENGKIQYPVEEITIAGNLKDLYANIVSIANDTEKRSNILVGSILLNNMMIGGN